MSANRKRITIITSPSSSTKSLPAFPGSSPTTGKPVQYRIEERKRTVYVTSDVAPTEWDQESLDTIFNTADSDEKDTSSNNPVYDAREMMTPRLTPNRLRRPGNKGSPLQVTRSVGTLPESPRRSPVQPRRKILFYHKNDPYYGFTNFSAHPVIYRGKRYPTSEHLFQSFKFHDHRPGLAEHIRTCSERPSVAFSEARRFQPEVRPDWMQVNIPMMEEALWHKFTQHADLQAELLGTGDAELIEASPTIDPSIKRTFHTSNLRPTGLG
ncbi:hypothetical protein MD484_g3081, partial [Candolleomyces efflorescens]